MNDSLAQLVEQLTLNQWVEGSNPSGVTKGGRNSTLFLSFIHGWRCVAFFKHGFFLVSGLFRWVGLVGAAAPR